ncbi:MAG: YgiQ family radical SAM protein [Myxococcales bacterium]
MSLLADLPLPARRLPPAERPFLPTSLDEARARGWNELDVVLVTGDAYVDHPSFGASVIGRVLEAAGYRVGVLPQPDWKSAEAFRSLGRPRLFFGITSGNLDSMVNHYTAHKRRRSDDAFSPDAKAGLRPDRAATVFAQRCREAFKDVPIVLGGVEASLRRLAHYDWWDDAVRRSVLFDAKADLLVYGQGERPILEVAARLAKGVEPKAIDDVAGIAVIRKTWDDLSAKWGRETVVLPAFEAIREDREAYARCSRAWHLEHNPANARVLVQPHGDRAVVVFPPAVSPTTEELDRVFALPYSRGPHPRYRGARIPAWEQIKDSVQIVRGCCAGCSFCSLAEHQGRELSSRSKQSVMRELEELASTKSFHGTLSDLGGPTANLWSMGCGDPKAKALCRRPSCVFPNICSRLAIDHAPLIDLYQSARKVPGINHAFIGSGVRYDVAHADEKSGQRYLEELVRHHVSGHLKVAPEHVSERVLQVMRKPGLDEFERLRREFEGISKSARKEQYLVPYFISSHPGCALEDAGELHDYLKGNHWKPQQVQDFMPTPMTLATDMFFTGLDPTSMKPVFVETSLEGKKMQKALVRWADPELKPFYERAVRRLKGRR